MRSVMMGLALYEVGGSLFTQPLNGLSEMLPGAKSLRKEGATKRFAPVVAQFGYIIFSIFLVREITLLVATISLTCDNV